MTRALILSGGIFHDFAATSTWLAERLAGLGAHSEVCEDLEGGLGRIAEFDLLVVNALRWRMHGEKYDPYRAEHEYSPTVQARRAIVSHLALGRGLLAMHTAVICFDDWPEWGDLLGARWEWGRSFHPALGAVRVDVAWPENPLVAGIQPFAVEDEVYGFLDQRAHLLPLLTSAHGGQDHPLAWVRNGPGGRVAVDLLGHSVDSLRAPEHALLVERLMRWVLA